MIRLGYRAYHRTCLEALRRSRVDVDDGDWTRKAMRVTQRGEGRTPQIIHRSYQPTPMFSTTFSCFVVCLIIHARPLTSTTTTSRLPALQPLTTTNTASDPTYSHASVRRSTFNVCRWWDYMAMFARFPSDPITIKA